MPRMLDVGCGRNKYPGAVGVDRNPATDADLLCDLSCPPYPFHESSFDEIRAVHVVEHLEDVIKFMEEMHRLLRPAGRLYLVTPHYTDSGSFRDPTHHWHLNSFSFYYFTEPRDYGFYSPVRFHEHRVVVRLLRLWRWLGLEWLVNRSRTFRKFWEHYLCFLVRGKEVHFWFDALKPDEHGKPP
ncbi:MAG: methyltransferase domain-containing protein [Terriglobia bacterium]